MCSRHIERLHDAHFHALDVVLQKLLGQSASALCHLEIFVREVQLVIHINHIRDHRNDSLFQSPFRNHHIIPRHAHAGELRIGPGVSQQWLADAKRRLARVVGIEAVESPALPP